MSSESSNEGMPYVTTNGVTVHNPTPHLLPDGENAKPLEVIGATATDKVVLVMVGLPACGKTHIARRVLRYLNYFLDIPTEIFTTGEYRRKLCGDKLPPSFYDPDNKEAAEKRHQACDAALADLVDYMKQDGVRVCAFDASNLVKERRQYVVKTLNESNCKAKVIFIESITLDEKLLEENIRTVKLGNPDYKGVDPEEAYSDFMERRKNYEREYDTLEDDEGAFIKVIDSKKFVVNCVRGYLPLKIANFIMNLHNMSRKFYLTRHGQSNYNVIGKIGGDSSLSENGLEYARRLAKFAEEQIATIVKVDENGKEVKVQQPCRLWTSTLRRTQETAQFIKHPLITWTWDNGDVVDWCQFRPMVKPNLDEIYAGMCDGMTYGEIEEAYPEEFDRRQRDKLAYRYPRGESYMDVILRLEPIAHELERTREPVIVVGHQGIHRILYAYFMGLSRDESPYVSIPLNTVIEITPHTYGCTERRIILMDKKEMLKDGQDEPVTSMPVANSTTRSAGQGSDDDSILDVPSH